MGRFNFRGNMFLRQIGPIIGAVILPSIIRSKTFCEERCQKVAQEGLTRSVESAIAERKFSAAYQFLGEMSSGSERERLYGIVDAVLLETLMELELSYS